MADARALTIQGNGALTEIGDGDALIVGDGIFTPSGSTNDLTLTPDGTSVVIATGKTLDALGDVNLGDAAADSVSVIGEVDTDLVFVESVARRIDIADETAVDTAGSAMVLSGSGGGVASASAGGAGGAASVVGAVGGAAATTFIGGAGGAGQLIGGVGGVGVAGAVAGTGGGVLLTGGDGGGDGGAGGGTGGAATMAGGAGTAAEDGGAATVRGGSAPGAGTDGAVAIGDADTSAINIGNPSDNPTTDILGTGAVGIAGATTFSAAGTALTVDNNALVTGTLDAATIDRTGTIDIGVTNGTSITIGRTGQLTTIAGDLQVDGTETVTGGTTFESSATFEGNVIFGNAATDTVQFGASDAVGSRIGPTGSPNMHFVLEVNHTIDVDQSTTATTVGGTLSIASGIGSVASGGGAAGGAGGAFSAASAAGGAGSGTDVGGAGGAATYAAGVGGAGTATGDPGVGGALALIAGAGGADGGAGGAIGGSVSIDAGVGTGAIELAPGSINIGTTTALAINLGSGVTPTIVDGIVQLNEQAGDTGGTANAGEIYTKDDGGVTELFYSDSDGVVSQLTPASVAANATNVVTPQTATEAIAAGAPVNIVDEGGSPVIREADADDTARQRVIGLAQAAIADLATGNVVMSGPLAVPDAQWDVLPAVGDVGEPVFLSTTVGNLTITAPTGNVGVTDVGTIALGGTGAVVVLVNIKLPIKSI